MRRRRSLALISLAFPVITLVALWAVWSAVSKAREFKRHQWAALARASGGGAHRSHPHPAHVPVQLGAGQRGHIRRIYRRSGTRCCSASSSSSDLWLLSLVMGHVRGNDRLSPSHARAVLDQWAYITGVSIAVYLLVQFVK